MTKIDIYSGFLGAGKTTLIKKMIKEAYQGEKLVLIENEFGEIGIDGGFLQEAGIEITEMNSGCICCSLVGDFGKALTKVITEYAPDRILIEPSGVGKLSDVIAAVKKVISGQITLGNCVAVIDATKCRMYMKNFGEFYNNQVETADTIFLSRTDSISEDKLHKTIELLRTHNTAAEIVTTPWSELTGAQMLETMEKKSTLAGELAAMEAEAACPVCGGHHHGGHDEHDHDHAHHACCGHEEHEHDHDHDEHDGEHEHHHDHDDHDEVHEHHHEHDEHCGCGCEDHDHAHHHHADEVFTSWGVETAKKFTADRISEILAELEDEHQYGMILRAKGYVAGENGQWIHFDYVPGEPDVRGGGAAATGRICVIGSGINEQAVAALFGA